MMAVLIARGSRVGAVRGLVVGRPCSRWRSATERRRDRDRGSISGFVVVLTLAVVACGGLVLDGARIVGAKVEAADHAENAARAGAQEIIARDGVITLDVPAARQAALSYLGSVGVTGSVAVTPSRITVSVSRTVGTTLLALVGVGAKTVSASRSSDPVSQ